jgi:hypothetical protein
MPKFLPGCHYNEEEISRHLKWKIGYWPVQINGNKFATGQILEKPVEVVKGWNLAGWAQKSPEPWSMEISMVVLIYTQEEEYLVHCFHMRKSS